MSLFVLAPFGSAGDVNPFIWMGRALRARGHEVWLLCAPSFAEGARKAGLNVRVVGTEAEERAILENQDIWSGNKGHQVVFHWVAEAMEAYEKAILEIVGDRCDVAMVAGSVSMGPRLVRETRGIPLITAHVQPSCFISVHDTALYFWWMEWFRHMPRWFKRLFFSLPSPMDKIVMPKLRALCEARGLPPPRTMFGDWWNSPDGVLAVFPEWFAPAQPDWPRPCAHVGFPLEDLSKEHPLDPALVKFLDEGPAPLLFTPGSAMMHGEAFFKTAVAAARRLGMRALLATRYPDQLPKDLPPGVMHVPFAPFGTLFPRCAAVVHHGGIGTLSQALAAGVPQLIMPMAHDQPDNARRVRNLGVGLSIAPWRFKEKRVAEALKRLTTAKGYRKRAENIALRIRTDGSGPDVARVLEDMLLNAEARLALAK
jgi:UDP:flavonoid glycosyltransferase YjiC (YdhE family)